MLTIVQLRVLPTIKSEMGFDVTFKADMLEPSASELEWVGRANGGGSVFRGRRLPVGPKPADIGRVLARALVDLRVTSPSGPVLKELCDELRAESGSTWSFQAVSGHVLEAVRDASPVPRRTSPEQLIN